MFSVLISIVITAVLVVVSVVAGAKTGTTVFVGIVSILVSQYGIGFVVRRKTKKVQEELQSMMLQGQQRMNRKVQQFQSKPGGNYKMIQRQLEGDQNALFKQALDYIVHFEPLRKWSPLMGRQIATMRFQYLYQLKEFDQVDELLQQSGLFSGPMMIEPMQVAMKMARQFKNGDIEGVEKTFKKRAKWFRGARATLLYGTLSWVYVKEGKVEEARQLLAKGKEVTTNEALAHNWAQLSNGHTKNFSNAGLGEEWYSLYLETPKAPKQKRVVQQGGRKGKRMF